MGAMSSRGGNARRELPGTYRNYGETAKPVPRAKGCRSLRTWSAPQVQTNDARRPGGHVRRDYSAATGGTKA